MGAVRYGAAHEPLRIRHHPRQIRKLRSTRYEYVTRGGAGGGGGGGASS